MSVTLEEKSFPDEWRQFQRPELWTNKIMGRKKFVNAEFENPGYFNTDSLYPGIYPGVSCE
jgi:hypothetical protein